MGLAGAGRSSWTLPPFGAASRGSVTQPPPEQAVSVGLGGTVTEGECGINTLIGVIRCIRSLTQIHSLIHCYSSRFWFIQRSRGMWKTGSYLFSKWKKARF